MGICWRCGANPDTHATTCPQCGAPTEAVIAPAEAPPPSSPAPSPPPDPQIGPPEEAAPAPPEPIAPAPPRSRRRDLAIVAVVALLAGLAIGALVAGGSLDEVRADALARAAEGTWECDGGEADLGDVTVLVDRAGVYDLTLGEEGQEFHQRGVWSVREGELEVAFFSSPVVFDGVPESLEDTTLRGAFAGPYLGEDEELVIEVAVRSADEVIFTGGGDDDGLTCRKVDGDRPDIPQGVEGGG